MSNLETGYNLSQKSQINLTNPPWQKEGVRPATGQAQHLKSILIIIKQLSEAANESKQTYMVKQ